MRQSVDLLRERGAQIVRQRGESGGQIRLAFEAELQHVSWR